MMFKLTKEGLICDFMRLSQSLAGTVTEQAPIIVVLSEAKDHVAFSLILRFAQDDKAFDGLTARAGP